MHSTFHQNITSLVLCYSQPPIQCTTPDKQPGICKLVNYCPKIMTMLRNTTDRAYFRQSLCVGATEPGDIPMVCCEIDIPVINKFSKCGQSSYQVPKILARVPSKPGDWPWMTALKFVSSSNPNQAASFRCAGALISEDWVITAAHCVSGKLTVISVRLGDVNLNDSVADGATPVDVPVAEVVLHPQFKLTPPVNDIALIRLKDSVTFTETIRPICVLGGNKNFSGNEFYLHKQPFVTVWRDGLWTGLEENRVNVVDNEQCAYKYLKVRVVIDERILCTRGFGEDSYHIRSGAPLTIPIKNVYNLVGISSFGIAHDLEYPEVFTKVAAFSEWISNVTEITLVS